MDSNYRGDLSQRSLLYGSRCPRAITRAQQDLRLEELCAQADNQMELTVEMLNRWKQAARTFDDASKGLTISGMTVSSDAANQRLTNLYSYLQKKIDSLEPQVFFMCDTNPLLIREALERIDRAGKQLTNSLLLQQNLSRRAQNKIASSLNKLLADTPSQIRAIAIALDDGYQKESPKILQRAQKEWWKTMMGSAWLVEVEADLLACQSFFYKDKVGRQAVALPPCFDQLFVKLLALDKISILKSNNAHELRLLINGRSLGQQDTKESNILLSNFIRDQGERFGISLEHSL